MMMIAVSWNKPMPKITRKVGVGVQEKTEKKKKKERGEWRSIQKMIISHQVAGKGCEGEEGRKLC